MSSLVEIDAYLWSTVPEKIDTLVEKCAAPAWDIRTATASIYTKNDVGYYWNPHLEKAGVHFRPSFDIEEGAWCKSALDRAVGSKHVHMSPLTLEEVTDGSWVKVAYSPTLRRIGEAMNFFPAGGKKSGKTWMGISPSPLAGMLTTGLVGGGLGYGLGWLGEKLLPEKWKKGRLRKTLAILGALGGAAPGGGYMLANLMSGQPLNSDIWQSGLDMEDESPHRLGAALGGEEDKYAQATDKFVKKAFMGAGASNIPPVNVNKLGQTLWEVGASPQTAAATMSSVYAAQQLPGGMGPGYVTPRQTGLLGTMMGAAGGGLKGYAVGWGVGKALGLLTGMPPDTRKVLNRGGATLGIINSLMPRMFR